MTQTDPISPEDAVLDRYGKGAQEREAALCCPVSFDPKYLEVLPEEILERDYGCGDPTPYVKPGDTVLDLGSGGGKVCWIAAQIVGAEGEVIGVDMNTEMLALARQHHDAIAGKVGFDNVRYHRGMIQDLRLDLDRLDAELAERPVKNASDWLELRQIEQRLRSTEPMIADSSVDVVLSNCVLNLVRNEDKQPLFEEIYRVVKPGGRISISDIVCDRDVPLSMQQDPELWSGCISGAFREDLFLQAFADAGFHGVEIVHRDAEPWQVVEGIDFRSVTVRAFKAEAGEARDLGQKLIYHGPFTQVEDESGQLFERGVHTHVDSETFARLTGEAYAGTFTGIDAAGATEQPGSCKPSGGCC